MNSDGVRSHYRNEESYSLIFGRGCSRFPAALLGAAGRAGGGTSRGAGGRLRARARGGAARPAGAAFPPLPPGRCRPPRPSPPRSAPGAAGPFPDRPGEAAVAVGPALTRGARNRGAPKLTAAGLAGVTGASGGRAGARAGPMGLYFPPKGNVCWSQRVRIRVQQVAESGCLNKTLPPPSSGP